jgi:hypothetical protein
MDCIDDHAQSYIDLINSTESGGDPVVRDKPFHPFPCIGHVSSRGIAIAISYLRSCDVGIAACGEPLQARAKMLGNAAYPM